MARHSRNKRNTKKTSFELKLLIFVLIILTLLFIISYTIWNFVNSTSNFEVTNFSNNFSVDSSSSEPHSKNDNKVIEENNDITFTMTAIGDVMCHNTQYWDAYNKATDTYDFSYVFDDIKYYTEAADITIGSLETSFAGKERGYSNYPTFNSPDALAYAVKDIGVDVLSTAGNHCLDMGFSGLSRTIDVLDEAGISHLGTYKTQEDRDTVLFKNVKGVKIAFINYTYGTNGIPIPSGKPYSVNLIDKDLIKKDIDSAKSQNADVVVACMHWGTEYRTTANLEQEELSDFLFKNGVDIILGNHPHVLEQMEKKNIILADGTTKECFVIYACGNFICDQNAENTRNSIILNLTITKHKDKKNLYYLEDNEPGFLLYLCH